MKHITAIILLIILISCGEDNHDEVYITSTVCIDGELNFSIVDGDNCFYMPITVENKTIKCEVK